jgi:hypothetical protein
LCQKGKLFLLFPTISTHNFVNFGQREGHVSDFKVWKIENLGNSKWSRGPLVSQRHRLTDRTGPQRARATPCPTTQRSSYYSSHRATALSSSPLTEWPCCAVPLPHRRATRQSNWTEHLFLEPSEPSSASQAGPKREPRLFHIA